MPNYTTRNDLVPWPVVIIVLVAIVLLCSSCMTLLAEFQEGTLFVSGPRSGRLTATTEAPVDVHDVTLAPRERDTSWSSAETQRPVSFYDSVITRLKYN